MAGGSATVTDRRGESSVRDRHSATPRKWIQSGYGFLIVVALFSGAGCERSAPAPAVPLADPPAAVQLPTCAMAMTEPVVLSGTQFFDSGDFEDCGYSRSVDGIVEVGLSVAPGGLMVLVDISSIVATPGNTDDIGSGAVSVATGSYALATAWLRGRATCRIGRCQRTPRAMTALMSWPGGGGIGTWGTTSSPYGPQWQDAWPSDTPSKQASSQFPKG